MEELVEIPRSTYERLTKAELLLQFLQAHGVDNWDGYSDAMGDFLDTEEGSS